jgi:hypothetical protein
MIQDFLSFEEASARIANASYLDGIEFPIAQA